MEVLATNKVPSQSNHNNHIDVIRHIASFAIDLFLPFMSCRTWLISTPSAQIPLSTIRRMEPYGDHVLWLKTTLCVVCSTGHR